jgi:hypothetical protein
MAMPARRLVLVLVVRQELVLLLVLKVPGTLLLVTTTKRAPDRIGMIRRSFRRRTTIVMMITDVKVARLILRLALAATLTFIKPPLGILVTGVATMTTA